MPGSPATNCQSARLVHRRRLALVAFAAGCAAFNAGDAAAHGYAGNRFFPATLTTDDPFVADELSLPTVSWYRNGERPAEGQTDVSAEFSKRIIDNLGLSIEPTWTHLDRRNEDDKSGFQNLEMALKYQFLTSAEHEAIASIGLETEIGGTGASKVGAENFSVLQPTLYFGKGAGDLPEGVGALRPLALTGFVGYGIPTDARHTTASVDEETGEVEREVERHAQTLAYGGSIQYSLPYLQANVFDTGLPEYLSRLIPVVELSFETPVQNTGGERSTTAFCNPGFIWTGQSFQVGAEAVVPLNRDTGTGVGFIAQLHFYLDDLFSTTLGRPIFPGVAGPSF